jgi:hypothetical protein
MISLNMRSKVELLNSFNIPRVSQLSHRSNQFNLRTIRYEDDDYPNEIDINLSSDNKKCIIDISNLCKKYNIDYTFMIGPNINLIDKLSLLKFKDFFKTNDIEINTNYYKISKKK